MASRKYRPKIIGTLTYPGGKVLLRATKPSAINGPRGVWMRDSQWRGAKPRKARLAGALDAFAARRVVYDLPTVCIRRRHLAP
jgi:hypothetical protein